MTPQKAQEIQDEIFKKMPFEKKIKSALDFSLFCLKLQKKQNGSGKYFEKNRKDIKRS